mgnify:CR=1 FL=1
MAKNNNSERNSELPSGKLFRRKVSPKSIKNLKPFKKGQTGNPKGRPLGRRSFETIFMTALEVFERNGEEAIQIEMFKNLITKARNGDVNSIKLFMDIRYGKP